MRNIAGESTQTNRWRWLGLAAATHTFAAAIPLSCLPVLFDEISRDLNLNIVQLGTVWGMVGLAGIFVSLIGGILGDKWGVRLVLGLICIIGGIVGASRGLAVGFISLAATVFLFGLIRSMIPINVHKAVSIWFQGRNLGLANGVVAAGMGIGMTVGPLLSATILSPLLGSWRYVLFLYAGVSVIIGLVWLFSRSASKPPVTSINPGRTGTVDLRRSISKLLRMKVLWLLGLTFLFQSGSLVGMVGYLPLYLINQGWSTPQADGALAAFFAASTLAVIPICFFSDRIRSRERLLFVSLITGAIGMGLIPLVDGPAVWVMVVMVGLSYDSFAALVVTLVRETKGIDTRYYGTALGIVFTFMQIGNCIAPPIGNSMAPHNAGFPFLFWAFLAVAGILCLLFSGKVHQPVKSPLPEG